MVWLVIDLFLEIFSQMIVNFVQKVERGPWLKWSSFTTLYGLYYECYKAIKDLHSREDLAPILIMFYVLYLVTLCNTQRDTFHSISTSSWTSVETSFSILPDDVNRQPLKCPLIRISIALLVIVFGKVNYANPSSLSLQLFHVLVVKVTLSGYNKYFSN